MTDNTGTPEGRYGGAPDPAEEPGRSSTHPTEPLGTPTQPLHEWWNDRHDAPSGADQQGHGGAPQQPAPMYGQHTPPPPTSAPGRTSGPQYGQYSGPGSFGTPTPVPPSQYPAASGKRPEKKKVGVGLFVASVVAAALIGGGAASGTSLLMANDSPSSSVVAPAQNNPLIVNNSDSVNAVTGAAQKASPSVVTISATSGQSGGTGSGIILDTDGHILTNTHVVTLDGQAADAAIEVRTNDGKVYQAKVVGTDPLNDLAVIKIDAPNLTPATLADSDKVNVGDTVVAIGAPLGLSGTVTDGIVSTLNRTIQVASSAVPKSQSDSSSGGNGGFNFAPPDGSSGNNSADQGSISINVIQTDAAINPGNSGGALANTKGEIIGVNVAIASAGSSSSSSSQTGNIGVGFAIPINDAKRVADEIIKNGSATHGQLGVSVKPQAASANSQFTVGAAIAEVTPGSAAAKAGLKVGDVITDFGSRTITDASELTAAVREQAAGATVKVTFLRDNKQQSADVTLGKASVG